MTLKEKTTNVAAACSAVRKKFSTSNDHYMKIRCRKSIEKYIIKQSKKYGVRPEHVKTLIMPRDI